MLLVISVGVADLVNSAPVESSSSMAITNFDRELENPQPVAPENFENLREIIAYIKLLRLYYKLEGRPR